MPPTYAAKLQIED